MIEESINTGDWQQINELKRMWKALLAEKELFVEKAMWLDMTPGQEAEVELKLAMITGKMKETDAKIHYLMFGGELGGSEPVMNLKWQVDMVHRIAESEKVKGMKRKISDLVRDKKVLQTRCYELHGTVEKLVRKELLLTIKQKS